MVGSKLSSFCVVVVQKIERGRDDVAVLLNDVWYGDLVEFRCINSRILWVKFKFAKVKACVVVIYSPTEDDDENERFWNDSDRISNG